MFKLFNKTKIEDIHFKNRAARRDYQKIHKLDKMPVAAMHVENQPVTKKSTETGLPLELQNRAARRAYQKKYKLDITPRGIVEPIVNIAKRQLKERREKANIRKKELIKLQKAALLKSNSNYATS